MTGTERKVMTHEDGYVTVCDPQRGIGIIAPPVERHGANWGVVFLFLCTDRPGCAEVHVVYGKN